MKSPIGRSVIVKIVDVQRLDVSRGKLVSTVKKAASQILSHLNHWKPQVGWICIMSMFREKVTRTLNLKTEIADTDLSILLTFLARDKRAILRS